MPTVQGKISGSTSFSEYLRITNIIKYLCTTKRMNDLEWMNKHPETSNGSINKKTTSGSARDDTGNDDKGTTPPYSEYTKLTIASVYVLLAHFATAVVTVIINDRALDLKKYPTLPDIVLDIVPFTPWANQACEVITLFLALVNITTLVFHKHR